jgi:hypothetical protein
MKLLARHHQFARFTSGLKQAGRPSLHALIWFC